MLKPPNARERRRAAAQRELLDLLQQVTEGQAAALLDVHPLTVQRWIDGRTAVPRAALIALRAAQGLLPGMTGRHWEGWSIGQDGLLRGPGCRGVHTGDILSLPYLHQLIAHQRRQIKLLGEKLREVDTGAANDPVEGELKGRPAAMP